MDTAKYNRIAKIRLDGWGMNVERSRLEVKVREFMLVMMFVSAVVVVLSGVSRSAIVTGQHHHDEQAALGVPFPAGTHASRLNG
ncbi:MAG: hypothetical protein WD070_04725 [Pirellulaceae bacterium]